MIATKVKIVIEIEEQRLRDLLCTAFEGGSTYWVRQANVAKMSVEQKAKIDAIIAEREANDDQGYYTHDYPFDGVNVTIVHDAIKGKRETERTVLTRDKLIKGIEVMAEKYPRHFADFMAEDDDAITGDVYLQCALFGEIIFG